MKWKLEWLLYRNVRNDDEPLAVYNYHRESRKHAYELKAAMVSSTKLHGGIVRGGQVRHEINDSTRNEINVTLIKKI